MIPDFKTYIKESIWSDIQDRSSGNMTRKEDAIPSYLKDCLLKYIEMCIDSNEYCAADLTEFTMYIEDYAYHPDIKKFDVDCDELIEYVENHWDDVVHPLIQKMILKEESIWSDIQDRSSGDVIRKEDDIDLLDEYDFFKYLLDTYESTDDDVHILNGSGPFCEESISVCVFEDDITQNYHYIWFDRLVTDKPIIYVDWGFFNKRIIELFDKLKKEYKVTIEHFPDRISDKYYRIEPKDGSKVTNSFFINVLDFILDRIEPPLKKKIEKK